MREKHVLDTRVTDSIIKSGLKDTEASISDSIANYSDTSHWLHLKL